MKYIEVELIGAKEVRLVVNDGGNGIGSEHVSFGDAKLYFANAARVYTAPTVLKSTIKEIETLDAKWNNFVKAREIATEILENKMLLN